MEEAKEVKLYGYWASSDCAIVRHALSLKSVAFDYIEEDPENKNVPLLTEKVWKHPPLLPEDPHLRARVLFWAEFFYQKLLQADFLESSPNLISGSYSKLIAVGLWFCLLMPTSFAIVQSGGEALSRANNEFIDHMATLEHGVAANFPGRGTFINGEKPGLLDVIMGSCTNGMGALEEVAGVELLQKERMPILFSAMTNFGGLEIATAIPYDKLAALHWAMREKARRMARP